VDKFSTVSHSIISGLTMPSCSHKCGLGTKIHNADSLCFCFLIGNLFTEIQTVSRTKISDLCIALTPMKTLACINTTNQTENEHNRKRMENVEDQNTSRP